MRVTGSEILEDLDKSKNITEIEGEVIKIRRFDSGYTILNILPEKKSGISAGRWGITLVGNMPLFVEGMNVRAKVTPVEHAKYGLQYKVDEIGEIGFNRADSLVDYLSSSIFKGIGHVIARKIVDKFGLQVLEIFDADPNKIMEIEGISGSKCDTFVENWIKHRESHRIISELMSFNMTMPLALKIYNHFKSDTIKIIKENPYKIIEIPGIGFHKADEIALHMGIPLNSIFRIKAAIVYVLDNIMYSNGHCYLTSTQVFLELRKLLKDAVVDKNIIEAIEILKEELTIIVEDNRMYLSHIYSAEKEVAECIKEMLNFNDSHMYSDVEELKSDLKKYDISSDIDFADEQLEAILMAMNSRVCVITGGPGTGKTTITKTICHLFRIKNIHYELCSPTGRAAKRLAEATGDTAQTIHRLLGYIAGGFERNSTNPLDTDCVLVDEFSMVDILLFRFLIDAMQVSSRLIMVGDADQLPSVGPGNVLHDLIESDIIPVVKLKKIFRQEKGSTIIEVAHQILNGEIPVLLSPGKSKGKNCMLVASEDKDTLISYVVDLVNIHLPKAGIPSSDIQVITPMREKGLGINDFNPRLQAVLNPPSPDKMEIKSEFRVLRVGDKVMQIRNDYNKDVFNGDIGYIVVINKENIETPVIGVQYPDKEHIIYYEQMDWGDLQLAFASTIHKFQGSEYPAIIMVLHPSQFIMLQRNLIYTGLTRARKICIIAGTQGAIETAVNNNKIQKRNTTLKQRLLKEED
jgi:exodeoxyribonuclease V alpha subunit